MQTRTWRIGAAMALLLSGCAPPEAPTPTGVSGSTTPRAATDEQAPRTVLAGWYSQDATQARFQPCGDAQALQVLEGGALRQRAASFGLADGDPVYVKIAGTRRGTDIVLDQIKQFGSPAPVRDCPMRGTTIQG